MQKEMVSSELFMPIVGDGAIATAAWGDGRLIPVLIVDASANINVKNLISIHADTPPGDVTTTWALKRFDKHSIFLKLEFLRPVNTTAYIPFDLRRHASLVSGIMISRAMYLQTSDSGKGVAEGLKNPKILIEVSAVLNGWREIYESAMILKYKRLNHSKKVACNLAVEHINRMDELWTSHVK